MMPEPPSFCHAKLPTAGLGNKLLVWAKALVFSQLNETPLVVTGWHTPHLRSFLRTGNARLYLNSVAHRNEVNAFSRVLASRLYALAEELPVERQAVCEPRTIYRFSLTPHWRDYFRDLKPYREEVRLGLRRLLTKARQREVDGLKPPDICVHVRCGDFRILPPGEDFRYAGSTRTPVGYFADVINELKKDIGSSASIRILTDTGGIQMSPLLSIPGVEFAPRMSAIASLFYMGGSRVLVTSAGSTFSYWGAFIGDGVVIHHPDHFHATIRPAEANLLPYEGPLSSMRDLLQGKRLG